jgi:hypothetical protein
MLPLILAILPLAFIIGVLWGIPVLLRYAGRRKRHARRRQGRRPLV